MTDNWKPPVDKKELHMREAIGNIRASRFVRDFAKKKEPITIKVVFQIQKEILKEAKPEIAGILRTREVKKLYSFLPPHPRDLPHLIQNLAIDIKEKLNNIPLIRGVFDTEGNLKDFDEVVHLAAWIHHQITWIHPFEDCNGRTARLMANLVLERAGLWPALEAKVESENRNTYLNALSQADKNDYEPLIDLIIDGLLEHFSKTNLEKIWM